MEDTRPAKRARQACEPCRRKKSRCPGERPVCSHCQRLGQSCVYAADDCGRFDTGQLRSNRQLESRMETLEAKLDSLIQHISPKESASQNPWNMASTTPSSLLVAADPAPPRQPYRRESTIDVPPRELSPVEIGRLYVTWCHNQPLALFSKATFPESLGSRDRELQLAIKALGLRFPPASITPQRRETLDSAVRESRKLAMNRVIDGNVDLSTLQTLCVLSVIDFAHGRSIQAGLNLSIASELAHRVQPGNYLGDETEFDDCTQAIKLLHKLQAPILPLGKPASTIPEAGSILTGEPPIPSYLSAEDRTCAQISWYSSQIGDAWQMAREYAASRIEGQHLPPWHPQSDYSSIMQRHLDFDSRIPMKYRFASNKFSDERPHDLQDRRDYWGPWLFMQIMYAAIPCLLNHPFLLSMRLRDFRYTMPQIFIHQSFEQITRCSGWIIFFLDLVERQGFEISDPALAHCVVVVATIHLQHSFVEDNVLRRKAQDGFEKCMRFLRRTGLIWPSVSVMADNLKTLQESVVGVPSPSTWTGGNQQAWSINAQLLWDLLIYEKAGRESASMDQSIFGGSFTPAAGANRQDVADFDLVGSAGISGHRSAPKEIPVYAPEDKAKTPAAVEASAGNGNRVGAEMGGSVENRLFEGLTGFSEQDSLFLQANDFGRAIDNWLSFDMT